MTPAQRGLTVQALGENGGPPQIPGPMIRVVEGTMLDVVVTKSDRKPVVLYGLRGRPGDGGTHRTYDRNFAGSAISRWSSRHFLLLGNDNRKIDSRT